jgi:hypothetical protein
MMALKKKLMKTIKLMLQMVVKIIGDHGIYVKLDNIIML